MIHIARWFLNGNLGLSLKPRDFQAVDHEVRDEIANAQANVSTFIA